MADISYALEGSLSGNYKSIYHITIMNITISGLQPQHHRGNGSYSNHKDDWCEQH